MEPRVDTSPPCIAGARLWWVRNTVAAVIAAGTAAGCSFAVPDPPPSVPEHLLSRSRAGVVTPSEELPGNVILVEREIGDPSDVVEMTVQLWVSEGSPPLPSGANQLVEREPFSLRTLEITAGPGDQVEAWELSYALEHDPEDIDAGERSIRRLSRSVVAGARTDRDKVERLVRWVYYSMRYQVSDTPRASDVARTLVGDCTEYTHLFLALARAAKLPSRRVVGLAYTEFRGQPAFGYHAWAEVAIDGYWVPVDPTWNEVVADATHIKLSEGWSRDWGSKLRLLDVEVLSVIKRSSAYSSRRIAPSDDMTSPTASAAAWSSRDAG